eukprot:7424581-Pyramimonas_sp.AAC.1
MVQGRRLRCPCAQAGEEVLEVAAPVLPRPEQRVPPIALDFLEQLASALDAVAVGLPLLLGLRSRRIVHALGRLELGSHAGRPR